MTPQLWVLIPMLMLSSVPFPVPAKYPNTPVGVVRFYCSFDLSIGRISSENFEKLPPLVTWEDEPGWDGVTIASEFTILSSKQSKDHAIVRVRWNVLGQSIAENVTIGEKSEVVEYHLQLVNGLWKIAAPVLPPHVALFTLREFVQSHFQDEAERRQVWLKNLDSMQHKLGARANSMPPGVLEALGGDEKDCCEQLGAFKKGCVQIFRANLSWREIVVTPQGQNAILVENRGSCGSAGCALSLFIQQEGGKFVQVLGANGEVGTLSRVKVLTMVTDGHYDLQKRWHEGKTRTLYQWNGGWYSSSEP